MGRLIRNTVVLAKVEAIYGTDPVPTGGANAMLVSNLSINPINAQYVDRDLIRGFMGASEQLVGTRFAECSFDVELVGSGVAGTAPAWSPLMLACGWAETVTAATRVDYTLISTGQSSVTIYWYDDGLLHKLTGARGDLTAKFTSGGRPMLSFSFKGVYNTPTAAANATPTYTSFKTPQTVIDANTMDLTFGATHSTSGAPALVGGTTYPSQGIEFALANEVNYIPLLGGESVEITDRKSNCKFQLDLTAANEAAFMAEVEAATLTSIGLLHGTAAGYKSMLFLPFVQKINPSKQDLTGKRMIGFDGRVTPSLGNDEARIVTSF